jgi:hypothetical protein
MAQPSNHDVNVIGASHTATNQRPEVSLHRRAHDSDEPRRWHHGEHPESMRHEPGQEPPRADQANIAGPYLR